MHTAGYWSSGRLMSCFEYGPNVVLTDFFGIPQTYDLGVTRASLGRLSTFLSYGTYEPKPLWLSKQPSCSIRLMF